MYNDFDDDIMLGAEAMVVLPDEALLDLLDGEAAADAGWGRSDTPFHEGPQAGLHADDSDIRDVIDRIFSVRPE
jgi:hypothetical protein